MRIFIVVSMLLLAACETSPQPPPPHVQRLQFYCSEGDVQACGALTQMDQAERQQRTAALGMLNQSIAAQNAAQVDLFTRPRALNSSRRNRPDGYGGM